MFMALFLGFLWASEGSTLVSIARKGVRVAGIGDLGSPTGAEEATGVRGADGERGSNWFVA